MDQLDDKLRAAMQALEAGATPRGYFDGLPAQIEARLEGSMQTESESTSDHSTGIPPMERNEDSGAHDIKALARSTRQRISRRQTSQHDIEDSLLSSSQSGMHAIALPDPAKMIGLPSPEEAKALSQSMSMRAVADATGAPAVAQEPIIAASRRPEKARGVPVWLWAGGGIGVAAAAAIAFMVLGKDKGTDEKQAAQAAAGEDKGSSMVASRGDDDEGRYKAPAPTEPQAKKADESVTVTGLTDAAEIATGTAAGSGTAAVVAAVPADAVDDKSSDKPKKEHHASGSSSGSGSSAGSGSGSGSSSAKVKADPDVKAPPDDKGTGKGSSKGSSKGSAKGTGEGGAVLGAGDSDELGIGDAIKGGDGEKHEDKPSKTELTSKELRAGLDAVVGKAKACYDGAVGTVKVKLTVASTGKVTKASASGDLAGTPAASCVVDAIKGASFPAWTGAPMSTTYAVLLSD